MSKKLIFNKEKCINDEGFLFLKRILGDTFEKESMGWINKCDGKLCYEEDGKLYCDPENIGMLPYNIKESWCDIIEVEDTEDVKDDGIKITYIGEKKEY